MKDMDGRRKEQREPGWWFLKEPLQVNLRMESLDRRGWPGGSRKAGESLVDATRVTR